MAINNSADTLNAALTLNGDPITFTDLSVVSFLGGFGVNNTTAISVISTELISITSSINNVDIRGTGATLQATASLGLIGQNFTELTCVDGEMTISAGTTLSMTSTDAMTINSSSTLSLTASQAINLNSVTDSTWSVSSGSLNLECNSSQVNISGNSFALGTSGFGTGDMGLAVADGNMTLTTASVGGEFLTLQSYTGSVRIFAFTSGQVFSATSDGIVLTSTTTAQWVGLPTQTGTVAAPTHTPPAGFSYVIVDSSGNLAQFSA